MFSFEAGVRLGRMIAVRITPDMEMAVLTPSRIFGAMVLRRRPPILDAHPCIAYQFADGNHYQWELVQDGKRVTHRPEGQWAFSDSYMEAEAARLGLGLAYVPVELMGDDPERGTLIRVLQRYSLRMDGLYLDYPHRNVSPALRAVIDTLKI